MDASDTYCGLSVGRLALVLAGLLCLTAATVAVARHDTGYLKIAVALAIAAAKACLVLFFFMGLGHAGRAISVALVVTLVILAIFIGFIFFDVAYRQ